MDISPGPRRLTGTMRFLAELEALAVECVAAGVWDDELTARRRQREDDRAVVPQHEERQVRVL